MTLDWARSPNGALVSCSVQIWEVEWKRLINPIASDDNLDVALAKILASQAPGLDWHYAAHFERKLVNNGYADGHAAYIAKIVIDR